MEERERRGDKWDVGRERERQLVSEGEKERNI
jgi:hypothetical protein